MKNYGFVKVACAIPNVTIANCKENGNSIIDLSIQAAQQGAQYICFPELAITGYTCADLFNQELLIESAQRTIADIISKTKDITSILIIGAPIMVHGKLFNCAIVLQQGKILGIIPKTYLPNSNEFYEQRWFTSALDNREESITYASQTVPFGTDIIFKSGEQLFSIELCEDLWSVTPPSSLQALAGSQLIFNLSASNELIGKEAYRQQLVAQQSARCMAGYIYASSGFGESSTDLLFASSAIIAENGSILSQSERFAMQAQIVYGEIDLDHLNHDRAKNNSFKIGLDSNHANYRYISFTAPESSIINLSRTYTPYPFIPSGNALNERCQEITNIQANALAIRLKHAHINRAVIGISGGLDSTLALLVTVEAFDRLHIDRKHIIAITMPGFGTTNRTYTNAIKLIETLGVTLKEINIADACMQHFKDINHNAEVHDITYENTQARERTKILMNIANQQGGLVIGTGDLSELALGWATYNGDHMSMYAVNCSIPKTLVKHLVHWSATHNVDEKSKAILLDIIDTPISPELLPADEKGDIAQKTEEVVGPYELHDFFLYYFLRFGTPPSKIAFLAKLAFKENYSQETIKHWLAIFLRRFFTQQFKRSCMPDGPKVGSINLSPRGDWRMPSDASYELWINELNNIE